LCIPKIFLTCTLHQQFFFKAHLFSKAFNAWQYFWCVHCFVFNEYFEFYVLVFTYTYICIHWFNKNEAVIVLQLSGKYKYKFHCIIYIQKNIFLFSVVAFSSCVFFPNIDVDNL
jgi:hypothetical protein